MAFTYEEIMKLENPYEHLSTGDALAENAKILNALSDKEKIILATNLIVACPGFRLKNYYQQMSALRNSTQNQNTFYSTIIEAYEIRRRINALLDYRNKTPHNLLLEPEFNPASFHRFSTLAQLILKGNESAIAERLALCAPKDVWSKIARNIDTIFPTSSLRTKIQAAFTLHRNINDFLLGEKPEEFFTSRDFDRDTCHMFANMIRTLLKDHEEAIGSKLFARVSINTHGKIMRQLELLGTEVFDQTNPFKLIASTMNAKENEEKKKTSLATHPNSLFARPSTPPLVSGSLEQQDEVENEADDEKESSYYEGPLPELSVPGIDNDEEYLSLNYNS